MKIVKQGAWLLATLIVLGSCASNRGLTKDSTRFAPLAVQEVDFDYLSLRSKVRFEDPSLTLNATANMRIKKDSVIWVSLSPALGIEAARAMITTDTLILINRLQKEVITYNYRQLSNELNFEVNFAIVQAMLLGNLAEPIQPQDVVSQQEGHYVVDQARGPISMANYVDAQTMKLDRVEMVESPSQNRLTLTYSQFEALESFLFPYNGLISLQYTLNGEPSGTQIEITHQRAEVSDEPLEFPFSVPSRYDIR